MGVTGAPRARVVRLKNFAPAGTGAFGLASSETGRAMSPDALFRV
jgi:hypothetical protein